MRIQPPTWLGITVLVWGCTNAALPAGADPDAGRVLTMPDAATDLHDAAPVERVDASTPHEPPITDSGAQLTEATGMLVSSFLADHGDGWLTLIDTAWVLPPGQEAHLHARLNATQDVYLHEFSPLSPTGTHHTVLTVLDADAVGGASEGVSPGMMLGGHQLYGAGVGTKPTPLPDGVAMHVKPGQQLILDLHLFNVSDRMLEGTSGVLVKPIDKSKVVHEAEGILAGPLQLDIPIGHSVQSGRCTLSADSTIFHVGPHMHQLGVHLKAIAHSAADGDIVLYDGPYAFDSQQRYPVGPVDLHAGDVVSVECTYENDTDHRVSWGQSSLDEMCFIGLSRYPVQSGGSYLCTD